MLSNRFFAGLFTKPMFVSDDERRSNIVFLLLHDVVMHPTKTSRIKAIFAEDKTLNLALIAK